MKGGTKKIDDEWQRVQTIIQRKSLKQMSIQELASNIFEIRDNIPNMETLSKALKKSYRKKVLLFHPDKNPDYVAKEGEAHVPTELFKLFQEAHELLQNKIKVAKTFQEPEPKTNPVKKPKEEKVAPPHEKPKTKSPKQEKAAPPQQSPVKDAKTESQKKRDIKALKQKFAEKAKERFQRQEENTKRKEEMMKEDKSIFHYDNWSRYFSKDNETLQKEQFEKEKFKKEKQEKLEKEKQEKLEKEKQDKEKLEKEKQEKLEKDKQEKLEKEKLEKEKLEKEKKEKEAKQAKQLETLRKEAIRARSILQRNADRENRSRLLAHGKILDQKIRDYELAMERNYFATLKRKGTKRKRSSSTRNTNKRKKISSTDSIVQTFKNMKLNRSSDMRIS